MLTGATAVHALTATGVRRGRHRAGPRGLRRRRTDTPCSCAAAARGPRGRDRRRAEARPRCASSGAEPVVYGDGLLERVRALAPEGVDAALDLVGTDEAMDVSLALVADRDRIATIANFGRAPRRASSCSAAARGRTPATRSGRGPPELARLAGEARCASSSPRRTP